MPNHSSPSRTLLITRHPDGHESGDRYELWGFDWQAEALLAPLPVDPKARIPGGHRLAAIGNYLLEWGPLTLDDYYPCFPYRLYALDSAGGDPLATRPLRQGVWSKEKFWGRRTDFGNPDGGHEEYDQGRELLLLPLHNFLLNLIPTEGRGTFRLWNFDPAPGQAGNPDPLPEPWTPQGAFERIQYGRELLPVGNYVLDYAPDTGAYRLWSFDPQNPMPLARPLVQEGRWQDFGEDHRLLALDGFVLECILSEGRYRLWRFVPDAADPLCGPVREGVLPDAFSPKVELTAVERRRPIHVEAAEQPGSMDFMRKHIRHVVYYMVENRSFDHVCGWLYAHEDPRNIHCVGRDGPFDGASRDFWNRDTGGNKVHLDVYRDGRLSEDWLLEALDQDPYHECSDVLRQMFHTDPDAWQRGETPDMGGFVYNNGTPQVMQTFSPEQLPVLNGLARSFAVSDAWFCSMPGGTDVNRAFSLTGSALQQLNNFQNGDQYEYWPYTPHRPSIWKTLWSNGIDDWKIYHSTEWFDFVFSYHLFLQGQIPSLDADPSGHIGPLKDFMEDARKGELPAFSYIEPVWIAKDGTTSYHPGGDLVPGERALNEIYNALRSGPAWDETLLVITFDEHGGIFDHVPPPCARNPWPNDVNDGFCYNILGPRVPTLLVSPWIREQTVFRSPTDVAYDSTSILATLLHWFGIPPMRWGLGERVARAPTFEGTLLREYPRSDSPAFTPPWDRDFPRAGGGHPDVPLNDLHRLMLPRLLWALGGGRADARACRREAEAMLERSRDLRGLHHRIQAFTAGL